MTTHSPRRDGRRGVAPSATPRLWAVVATVAYLVALVVFAVWLLGVGVPPPSVGLGAAFLAGFVGFAWYEELG